MPRTRKQPPTRDRTAAAYALLARYRGTPPPPASASAPSAAAAKAADDQRRAHQAADHANDLDDAAILLRSYANDTPISLTGWTTADARAIADRLQRRSEQIDQEHEL